jgi:excinuclease ABC subunit C
MSDPAAAGFDGKEFAGRLTLAPGVYRMLAADGGVLYVGKASSLRKRVASYFTRSPREPRLRVMIAQIARIEITVTRSEGEALLLENQLIKSLKPRYNILLRDDKSYPYIHLTTADESPRIRFHRGPRSQPGRYFGPYPGVSAVRDTLSLIHRLFGLRSCEDSVFKNRTRPCLQYQIKRCSGPCVGMIDADDYALSVRRAALLLDGRSEDLVSELMSEMDRAAIALEFEQAARLRDMVAAVRKVQSRQAVDGEHAELDVLACVVDGGRACVLLLSFRDGRNLGSRSFFPKLNGADDAAEVLGAFLTQYYLDQAPPKEIVLSHAVPDQTLIETVLSEQAGRKVELKLQVRTDRARLLQLARQNAELALKSEIASAASQRARLDALQALLDLPEPPQRIECFDISHTQGEATVASCVVFDADGPVRSQYRRFNINDITPGDDYAAMHQALSRRFKRAVEEGVLPDLLLIDGGRGQLDQALAVLAELDVQGLAVIGVAKGEERRAGHEALIFPDGRSLRPGADSPGLQLIQQVRDEAHRFAITGHRGRRAKARDRSRLEDIDGIGAKRRAALLRHFGGLSGLKRASSEDIARVEGINDALAQRIYAALHGLEPAASDVTTE